ncbi:hypothetical protein QBC35DRAFT_502011 [Podospora australis]|uniref:Uncharacterized protein n=1 Tax=Podospora australis TaxID=1536484 RepID=A0AAN7AGB3_9PEZI|nr:hypothetical protein QBC35DRAFT_502011 [Podospora australis]
MLTAQFLRRATVSLGRRGWGGHVRGRREGRVAVLRNGNEFGCDCHCGSFGQQHHQVRMSHYGHDISRIVDRCMTVYLNTTSSLFTTEKLKSLAISSIKKDLLPGEDHDASVILVSKSLASWLEDSSFMAQLVQLVWSVTPDKTPAKSFSVLTAAVDEVPPPPQARENWKASTVGLSILRGSASRMLPGLWEAGAGSQQKLDQPAFLDFRVPGLQSASQPLHVTLPLAHTIFSNGKPYTFTASRWQTTAGAFRNEVSLVGSVEKTTQTIVLPSHHSSLQMRTALVPLTKPHKIIAGLGNILRQVEVGARLEPASKELESVIPALLNRRLKHSDPAQGGQASGAVGVWALIIPKEVANISSYPLPSALDVECYDPEKVGNLAQQTSDVMEGLLSQGCQLRKILSGGGGWGLKQGLLSLDPQTKFTAEEHEDLESFMRSFRGEEDTGGIVTPGTYVQFFTELHPAETRDRPVLRTLTEALRYVIGTSGTSTRAMGDNVIAQTYPNLFGAVSSEGIYLSSEGSALRTKLDAPRSFVVSREDHL